MITLCFALYHTVACIARDSFHKCRWRVVGLYAIPKAVKPTSVYSIPLLRNAFIGLERNELLLLP